MCSECVVSGLVISVGVVSYDNAAVGVSTVCVEVRLLTMPI